MAKYLGKHRDQRPAKGDDKQSDQSKRQADLAAAHMRALASMQ